MQAGAFHIGVTGLVACQHTNTHTVINAGIGGVDGSVAQGQGVVLGVFEKQVGKVAALLERGSQHLTHSVFTDPEVVESGYSVGFYHANGLSSGVKSAAS